MKRIQALDAARGFTVLFVPAIHAVMLYSKPDVHTTWFGYWLTFIAEGPGAQIFMTIMGIAFTFKEKYNTGQLIKRAALLLAAGYLLNTLKFIVPFAAGILPNEIASELQLTKGNEYVELLRMGDILHFAAIALLLLHIIYQLRNYWFWSSIIALVLIFTAPMLYDVDDNYIIQLFTGKPPQIFFPVLAWIIYPLIGLTNGYGLKRNQTEAFQYTKIAGLITLVTGCIMYYIHPETSDYGFYRTYPAETFLHISVALLSLWLWHKLTPLIIHSKFFQLIFFCSKNITVIYLLQWILICWVVPFTGYQTMNLIQSIMMAIYMSTITFSITALLIKIKI